jgi:hypothetical protein
MAIRICQSGTFYQIKYFDSNLYRNGCKTFSLLKPDPEKKLLDFWLTLKTDLFITACPDAIYMYAVETNHPVIGAKNFSFMPEIESYYNKFNRL